MSAELLAYRLRPLTPLTFVAAIALSAQACGDGGAATGVARDFATANDGGTSAPAIDIEKATNGEDADTPTGPTIPVGATVTWTYVVTNTGTVSLSEIKVVDDQLGVIECPQTTLAAGQSMTCTAAGTAQAGQYANVGTVTGRVGPDLTVTDSDPSHYFGATPSSPGIDIEKATNGEDADTPTGPTIPVGGAVTWTYVVTNTGNVGLSDVNVVDDQLGAITCPKTTLAAGESMTCAAAGTAQAGQYANLGTVTGRVGPDRTVTDSDPSHYFGATPPSPGIDIEKATNGQDADAPTGPMIPVGGAVTWTYVVTNTGTVSLSDVKVVDDQLGAIACPQTTLVPGQSMTCSATGTAQAGQYANVGTATGRVGGDQTVTDSDPSHYFGFEPPVAGVGCSHGYWKNHLGSWGPTGYSSDQSVGSVFASTGAYPATASSTLLNALDFSGGPTVEDAVRNLLKQAVGSLLNAAHPGIAYPRTVAQVIDAVNAAVASGDRSTILSLAGDLDVENNLGCPLN